MSEENVVNCKRCHKVIFDYNDPDYADNHHESYVRKKLCSYCSMEPIHYDLGIDIKFVPFLLGITILLIFVLWILS